MRQRSVDQVGEHGLDDRVPAVGDVSHRGGLNAVGEERVVPPDREQLIEAGLVADPAHDQPGGHRLRCGGERGERGNLGDLGVADQLTSVGIVDRTWDWTGVHASSGMAAIAFVTVEFFTSTRENRAPARRQAKAIVLLPYAESPRTRTSPLAPAWRAVRTASVTIDAAPLPDPV